MSRSGGKNFGIDRKVLPQGIYMCNMNALPTLVQKLSPIIRLSFFFKSRSKVKVMVMG